MTVRQRKLIGIFVILGVLIGYAVAAVSLGDLLLPDGPFVLHLIYYAVAGVLWAIPAGIVIRWMQRPDEDKPT
jgi:hypothetical protein